MWVRRAAPPTDPSNPDIINIINCHTYGLTEGGRGVGNLIGSISPDGVESAVNSANGKINIIDCTSNGSVLYYSGTSYGQCGGLLGNIFVSNAYGFEINITNCTNNATVSGTTLKSRVGGIIGWIQGETNTTANPSGGVINIKGCKNNAELSASEYCGGILGFSTIFYRSDLIVNIENCANFGKVKSDTAVAGGIVAGVQGSVFKVRSCANYGAVTAGTNNVGGILAYTRKHASASTLEFYITDCANYGALSGKSDIGGLVGNSDSKLTIERGFNSGAITATDLISFTGGLAANAIEISAKDSFFLNAETDTVGTAITVSDAAKSATFTNWDFTNTWVIKNNLPVLKYLETETLPETPAATTAATTAATSAAATAASGETSASTSDFFWVMTAAAFIAALTRMFIARSRREN